LGAFTGLVLLDSLTIPLLLEDGVLIGLIRLLEKLEFPLPLVVEDP
jgi:hypothetical protein